MNRWPPMNLMWYHEYVTEKRPLAYIFPLNTYNSTFKCKQSAQRFTNVFIHTKGIYRTIYDIPRVFYRKIQFLLMDSNRNSFRW